MTEYDEAHFITFGWRKITNEELADLPNRWENSTIDTTKYSTTVFNVYQITFDKYVSLKKKGCLVLAWQETKYGFTVPNSKIKFYTGY